MDFFPEHLSAYIEKYSSPEQAVLAELNRETHLKHFLPQMVSGHQQGLFLELASRMIRPRQILEIGTFTGYSAICLAKGLAENGVLHTIDINRELEDITSKYYQKSGMDNRIKQYFGPAADIIPTLPDEFDLVFIDADKQNYALYYDLVFDRVSLGGFILVDNVLWSGKVAEPEQNDKDTRALHAFNQKVAADDRVTKLILSIRDGITLICKNKQA
ncbi:MAG: O-methyltransferase [Bacteroidia bacterium]